MRLVTWNIRLGIQQGLDPVVETLRDLGADVVALQEVGRNWVMGPHGDTTRELADAAGYPYYQFVPSLAWYPPAQYGHALLSRIPIESARVVRLPQSTDEPRTWLECRLQADDGLFTLISTHLSHVGDRPPQGELLARRVANRAPDERVIVMGDLNESDTSEPWLTRLLEACSPAPANSPTFPADAPLHRIDWIASTHGTWANASTPDTGEVSDHLPVVAELTW